MSRGKGRMTIMPRKVIDRTAKPGLSQGERSAAEKALARARAGAWLGHVPQIRVQPTEKRRRRAANKRARKARKVNR